MAELTGLEIGALTKEIGSTLLGTYVKNVYSFGTGQLLRFGGKDQDLWLVLSPKVGAWISEKAAERSETSEFTSRLRGELLRSGLVSVSQADLDRVFEFGFEKAEGERRLVLELMPPGNIIVTDGEGRILQLLREVRSPKRRLTKGGKYSQPAQTRTSPAAAEVTHVREALAKEPILGKAVGRHFALPRKYVAEVLTRLSAAEETPSSEFSGEEEKIANELQALVREATEGPSPCVCQTPSGEDIFAFAPAAFKVVREAPTLSELCDDLLLDRAQAEEEAPPVRTRGKEIEITVSRLEAQLAGLLEESSRLRKLAQRVREGGAETAQALLKSAGLQRPRITENLQAVASLIFDRAKELEAKADETRKAIRRLSRQAESAPTEKKRAPIRVRRARLEWYEKFRWFITTGGKLAVGGKDAQSNANLVRRHLDADDTVFHADLFGSPFFILKGGKSQTEAEVRQVAQATVAFSSAWKTGLASADSYWVRKDQVESAAPSGEYLPRGSFMIRGKKNPVGRSLVEIAVGIDSRGRVVSGPEEAIRSLSVPYVVLRPQNEKSSETAKKVLHELLNLSPVARGQDLTVDDVLRALPSGGGKVLRRSPGSSADSVTRNP